MTKYPEPTVGAFIRNKKGEILLINSYKWGGKIWNVPGGHIDWGETIEQASKREAKEEVGIDIEFIRVFATFEAIFPKDFLRKKHFLFLECECLIKPGEKIQIDHDEIQKACWFTLKDALKQNLDRWTRKSIKLLLKEKK